MTTGTGGDAVVETLRSAGVDTLFGIPGGHNIDLFDAVVRDGSIRAVLPRHEQGAGFMADGYARVGARTGVIACLEGPGMGNAMTALGEALQDSSPVLVVSSQIRSDLHGGGFGVIHELPDHLRTFRAATRFSARAATVEEIPAAVAGALGVHGGGQRPGPAHVEVPEDVLAAVGSWTAATVTRANAGVPPTAEAALDRAASVIIGGRRPVILAGAGASRGCAEGALTAFAEHLGAPVLTTALGKGAIREDHELYVATISLWSPWMSDGAVADLIASADPLIVVGSRLTDATTKNWQMPTPASIVRIDADPAVATNVYSIDVEVTCDAAAGIEALRALLPARNANAFSDAVLAEARRVPVDHARAAMAGGFDVVSSISQVLGPDTVLMGDSLIGLWAAVAWRTNRPRRYHVPMHFNTLGFALPAAIGAKLADPAAPAVALAGDGAFMFTMAELSAAVQEEVPVIAIVCNDGGFESIRRQQRAKFDGRMVSVDIRSPDFAAFARSVGAEGFTVGELVEFPSALEAAAATGRPSLIEVPLSVAAPWEAL
ncbi:MAG: thiamine pyrophosphate-binding protein [Ilumatobacteraceae bacterium]